MDVIGKVIGEEELGENFELAKVINLQSKTSDHMYFCPYSARPFMRTECFDFMKASASRQILGSSLSRPILRCPICNEVHGNEKWLTYNQGCRKIKLGVFTPNTIAKSDGFDSLSKMDPG